MDFVYFIETLPHCHVIFVAVQKNYLKIHFNLRFRCKKLKLKTMKIANTKKS